MKIYVDMERQEVTCCGETCNFYEAGLDGVIDRDVIEEHLQDRNDEDVVEVVFV